MPNWCTNHLTIEGDSGQIQDLANKIIRPNPENDGQLIFDFEGIFPMPEGLEFSTTSLASAAAEWFVHRPNSVILEEQARMYDWLYQALEQNFSSYSNWPTLTFAEAEAILRDDESLQKSVEVDMSIVDHIRRNLALYGSKDWYDWRVENWGTKWNACESTVCVSENSIDVFFETAWAPPAGVYQAICAAYPDLQLRAHYIEEGQWFAGAYHNDGHTLHDDFCSDAEIRSFGTQYFSLEWDDDAGC